MYICTYVYIREVLTNADEPVRLGGVAQNECQQQMESISPRGAEYLYIYHEFLRMTTL